MTFRKIMSGLLAGAMVLSMSATAFATSTDITGVDGLSEGAQIEITGETQTANIKIVVPTSGKVVLNPYELDYTVEGGTVNDQIISATQYIKNESNMGIKVGGTVTGTLEGADFAAATAVNETDKKVFLEFALDPVADENTALPGTNKVALTKTAQPLHEITLGKAGGTNPCAAFGFTGDASKNPTTPWSAEDVVGATIAFTFALDSSAGGSPTAGDATLTLDKTTLGATGTLAATFTANTSGRTVATWAWSTTDASVATVNSSGNDENADVTVVSTTSSDTCDIKVTATLDNGATLEATCTVTVP